MENRTNSKNGKEILEAARAVAFRFLGYSARSRAEIERRLARDEFEPEVIEAVLQEFIAAGWVDDAKFAQDWVEDRADRKRYGRTRLAAELRRKGIDRDTVAEVINTVDDDADLMRARTAAAERWEPGSLADLPADVARAEQRRCANFLQRRGFEWSIITQVLRDLMTNRE